MANNQKNEKTEQVAEGQQVQENVQQQPAATQQNQQTAEPEKTGFGAWLKRHWKGVVAGVTGTGALAASAIVAYKKGKAAGQQCVPVQTDEDYSLNPNE